MIKIRVLGNGEDTLTRLPPSLGFYLYLYIDRVWRVRSASSPTLADGRTETLAVCLLRPNLFRIFDFVMDDNMNEGNQRSFEPRVFHCHHRNSDCFQRC